MNRCDRLSMLIIDDQVDVLEVYQDVLQGQLGHFVECANTPGEALQLVRNQMFDIVVIDAKMTYMDAQMGGLLLANEISTILGASGIMLMSQFEIAGKVKKINPAFSFLSKPRATGNLVEWVEKELLAKIRQLVNRQYGFIIMPFMNDECNCCYREVIQPAMHDEGFMVKRMDEMPTSRPINNELLQRINDAHLVITYTSGPNPNVYFETGYAFANKKFLLLLAPNIEDMPFDLRSNHIIPIAESDPEGTRLLIRKFIRGLRIARD